MAYSVLMSLTRTTDQILNHKHYSISPQEKPKIISIDKYAILLQAFLEYFPEKGSSLEGKMRDVANEAEDIVEYFMLEQRSRWIDWTFGLSRFKFGWQLKKVMGKMDEIAEQVMEIKNSFRIIEQLDDSAAASSSLMHPPTRKTDMVGFDDELTEIKYRLCGESSYREVIPISGMGGIGKTTLARNAYEDLLIREHFQIRAWITVSQDYSKKEILTGLLDCMKGFAGEIFGRSSEENLYKILKFRRYLIVLDDMWSTEVWDDVKMIFPDDHNGSRIILTTRLLDVASYPDCSSHVHEMQLMDEVQSWNLLRQKAEFTHESHDYDPELEDIGREIARSCRGLPLAVVVIGGLLSTESKTRASWMKIAENVNSAVGAKDGQFEKILSLSYTHLPHHLRPCFLYMGGFPEDAEIRASVILKLWAAEGFVRASQYRSLEEEAEEYLEDLVKRSLILVTDRSANGKIKRCSIHDLMRDLCVRKAEEDKFCLHVVDRHKIVPKQIIRNQRRLCIDHNDLSCFPSIYSSSIRTVIYFQLTQRSLAPLRNLRLLRVLHVVKSYPDSSSDGDTGPPDELFYLFHLRYLALHYYIYIPEAITNLVNLETLILHRVRKGWAMEPATTYLSLKIWRMRKLKHVVSKHLSYIYGEHFVLENLLTLSSVIGLVCTREVMEMFPNLKKLGIHFTPERYDQDYQLCNLRYLHHLEKLKLEFCFWFNRELNPGYPFGEKLNLALPRRLKRLTLIKLKLPWEAMTVVGSLPNLEVLKLRNHACEGETWETTGGEFPCLKYLLISCSHLKHWVTETDHFPSLKCLSLQFCFKLSEIPEGIAEIPALEVIEIKGNRSLVESAKRIQEEQLSFGNESLQVRLQEY